MLYDLNFLNTGESWPLKDSDTKERIDKYVRNNKIYNDDHLALDDYEQAFRRIERVIGNWDNVISYTTLANYQKLISKKIADLLLSEAPNINNNDQATIEQIIINTKLLKKMYETVIDLSRYGDSVLYIYLDNDTNAANFQVLDPQVWVPIFDKFNKHRIIQHVLINEIEIDDEIELVVEIHEKGFFERRIYSTVKSEYGGKYVFDQLLSREIIKTGLSDFAILHLHNVSTSDSIFGEDDYTTLDSIIKEILIRISQIARILDLHANPSLSAPLSAFTKDPVTGELILKTGEAFIRSNKDDPDTSYITWDGKLDSAFEHLNQLITQLSITSEMGSLISQDKDKESNLSGRALKYKLLSPLTKAKRLSNFISYDFKKLISLLSELGGKNINKINANETSIEFKDGIPNDKLEEAEIIEKRRKSGTISIERTLSNFDELNDEQIETEVNLIKGKNDDEI